MITYLGLGSNLGDSKETIYSAFVDLSTHTGITLIQTSSLYGSKPHGPQDQPDYVNAVAEIETQLEPHKLLDALQQIENAHNRIRTGQHWGARTLDLDLLLYGGEEIRTKRLTVPHPHMTERSFVLYPLAEIKKDLIFPNGTALIDYLSRLVNDSNVNNASINDANSTKSSHELENSHELTNSHDDIWILEEEGGIT